MKELPGRRRRMAITENRSEGCSIDICTVIIRISGATLTKLLYILYVMYADIHIIYKFNYILYVFNSTEIFSI